MTIKHPLHIETQGKQKRYLNVICTKSLRLVIGGGNE